MNSITLNRRSVLQQLVAAACLSTATTAVTPAAIADDSLQTLYIPDEVDRAVRKAVEYLAGTQRESGALADRNHHVTMTSLAIMAMASIGTQPGDHSELGRVMQRAIDFVLTPRHQDDNGYFGKSDGSRMYGHGIITLMLTEVLGMGATVEQNERIHQALVPAIQLILAAQKVRKPELHQGGWRYEPRSSDSDLSASVWQLMALRSAKNDGMDVPGEAIDQAVKYLKASYTSPRKPRGSNVEVSGFSYTPGTHQATFTMTAAGLLAMQVCGLYDSPMVAGAADWLLEDPPQLHERYFYYGIYYYSQGMHQFGGKHAETAAKLVSDLLLGAQHQTGAWQPQREEHNYGSVYATSLAVLSLSVRYHYLPIYQR
ncbi:putative secreted protein [Rhodopirellula maiorica SM1]|uniref:Putative secreted protein n=1 Tax=Rhodopirellula maiorica SM1 TaxID=1265738 RepID=M5RQA6_9BACT|nr:prenyltransferase/squalene oxidase repeat-containing protein [Rhodopirellula maiorica]EMI21523.1 putative secreted protein [Rhodopirellula maiorica SM1]